MESGQKPYSERLATSFVAQFSKARSFSIGVLIAGAVLGFCIAALTLNVNGTTVTVRATGAAEWMYHDTHGIDNPLDVEKYGTPANPKGLELLPLFNRTISKDGKSFLGLQDGRVFSLDRAMGTGSIYFTGTDRTPIDATNSKDSAKGEATFTGPDGAHFRVVLRELAPPNFSMQAFGGVAINQPVHATTGFGTDKLYTEYTHLLIQGFADIYRDGKLITENNYLWLAVTRRAQFITNDEKEAGDYNPDKPLGDMIVHLVLMPHQLRPDGTYTHNPIPTGVIGLDGKEQDFFHINYRENLSLEGSKFFHLNPSSAGGMPVH